MSKASSSATIALARRFAVHRRLRDEGVRSKQRPAGRPEGRSSRQEFADARFVAGRGHQQDESNGRRRREEARPPPDEIAKTADNTSKGAMSKANQNTKDLNDLRSVVANIDDYKPAGHDGRAFCREQGHADEG